MPKWLVLYGLIYNEEGYYIRSHIPFYKKDLGGWSIESHIATEFPSFQESYYQRSRGYAMLLRIRSHINYMICRLQEWQGYQKALALL